MHDLQEVHDMAQNMAEIWKEQYRQRFLQEGRLEGRQEGRQEGEFGMLSRLLTRRFGALPEAVVARMRSADSEQLELWGERVLDASSLDDVFR
ncbi:putative transposase [Alcanivorax sp. S71-1-4]|nr:putative transposase [Alcanivorax sp. S71-1-4]